MEKDLSKYRKTEFFEVMDVMSVPHPFCITEKHVVHASDNYSGMLTKDAIDSLERKIGRPSCGIKGCNLKYHEHKLALAVGCKIKDEVELREYLMSILKLAEEDGYEGFVLVDKFSNESTTV